MRAFVYRDDRTYKIRVFSEVWIIAYGLAPCLKGATDNPLRGLLRPTNKSPSRELQRANLEQPDPIFGDDSDC